VKFGMHISVERDVNSFLFHQMKCTAKISIASRLSVVIESRLKMIKTELLLVGRSHLHEATVPTEAKS
jgi:hypothetical protein